MRKIYVLFALFGWFTAMGQTTERTCGPSHKEIFDFSVGDIFQYEEERISSAGGSGETTTITTKSTVTEKTVNGDSISYTFKILMRTDYSCKGPNTFESWCSRPSLSSEYISTKVYVDSADNYLNLCDSSIAENFAPADFNDFFYNKPVYARVFVSQQNNQPAKKIGGYNDIFIKGGDENLINPMEMTYNEEYMKGLGLKYANFWFFEFTSSKVLSAYVKDGDTVGNLKADSELIIPKPVYDCYDPTKVCKDCFTLTVWRPVCGCDGKKYGNSGEAEINGIVAWEDISGLEEKEYLSQCVGSETEIAVREGFMYEWSTGEWGNSITVSPTSSTDYSVKILTQNGCNVEKTFAVAVTEPFKMQIDTVISLGDSVHIGSAFYTLPGKFSQTFTSAKGCDSIVNLTISLKEFDTCHYQIFDTVRLTVTDTVIVYDTTKIIKTDTTVIEMMVYDTVRYSKIDTVYVRLVDTSDATGIDHSTEIAIYPSPVDKELVLESASDNIRSFTLYDASGTVIVKNEDIDTVKTIINVENFPSGTYFVKIKLDTYGELTQQVSIK